jgi:hypothetical protein
MDCRNCAGSDDSNELPLGEYGSNTKRISFVTSDIKVGYTGAQDQMRRTIRPMHSHFHLLGVDQLAALQMNGHGILFRQNDVANLVPLERTHTLR